MLRESALSWHARIQPRFQMSSKWQKLLKMADREVAEIMEKLPKILRDKTKSVAVIFQSRHGPGGQDNDFDPDLLGLFIGEPFSDEGSGLEPAPSQIILFPENIWNYATGKEKAYRREVRRTYLHELGHYLGLEEEDLMLRGLD